MPPTTGYSAAIDTDDLIMSYVAESAWGTTPSTPAFQNIRLDSEGFTGSKSRSRPAEIDPAGQASAAITTKEEATGSLNFSVSAGLASNVLMAASVGGVWTTPLAYTGTDMVISASSVPNKTMILTAAGATFTDGADLVIVGQFVKLYSSDGAKYSGIARVKAVSSDTVLLLDCVSGTPVDGALGSTASMKGSCLRNGTTFNSFTFQKKLSAALFLRYAGSLPTGGSLDVGVGDYLKGTMSFLCKSQVSATTEIAGNSYIAAPTGTVIDSVKGIGTVWRGVDTGVTPGAPAPIAGIVQKLGLKWNKEGASAQYGIGSAAAAGMRKGKLLVTGAMSTFFNDFALYEQFISESMGPISFYALDGLVTASATKGYVLTFCNAAIMNPKVIAGGPGQDTMADFEIEGAPDVCGMFAGKTIQLDYFA